MTPETALDEFAFTVGLQLMGPDARRRMHLSLLRHPEAKLPTSGIAERLERLDALIEGRRPAETLQDRLDLARVERERAEPPFDDTFWTERRAALVRAGFAVEHAAEIVQTVRSSVELPRENIWEKPCDLESQA